MIAGNIVGGMISPPAERTARRVARRRRTAVMLAAVVLLIADLLVAAVGGVGGAHRHHGPVVGVDPAPGSTTSAPVTTVRPTTTLKAVVPTTARPVATPAPAAASGSVPVTTGAPASPSCVQSACVTLDGSSAIGTVSHPGSGFNFLPGGPTSVSQLTMVGMNMFRATPGTNGPSTSFDHLNWSNWDAAVQSGAQTTLLLSDLWVQLHPGGPPPTPWSDWNTYNQWVKSTVQGIVQSGHRIDYWDVYNEPGWNNYYSHSDFESETVSDLLQQFLVTYQDIKAVDPGARIIGPSVGDTAFTPHPTDDPVTHEPDMTTFLDFAAAHHLQLAAVAWHHNGQTPAQIQALAAQVWQLVRSLPALGNPQMFLDEYGSRADQSIPGWDVGFLAAITNGGISSAVRSCWDDCLVASADGLLPDDGAGKTSEYYERVVYASMSGVMIKATSTSSQVAALASRSSSGQQMTALIGRLVGCAVASWCQSGWGQAGAKPVAPAPIGVSVVLPWSTANTHINLSYEPFTPGANSSGPIATQAVDPTIHPDGAGHEVLSFVIPNFADGSAYNLTLSPA
ncbi:MAG TPA: hypothetical protein VG435_03305 [Acidimicrobiales bacterium]|nr:hypothetical protein [Acidimicrobiales bacterium]